MMNIQKILIPIMAFVFIGILRAEKMPVIYFDIIHTYGAVRDDVPVKYAGKELETKNNLTLDISWSFKIKPDNKAYLSLRYGSGNGMRVGCRIKDGRLTYNEVIEKLEKVKAAPPSEQDVDYQALILHEGEDGTTGRMYLKNPDLWNYIIDKIEGHLLFVVVWPVEDSPAYMNFFKREFQNIRMPTPDPQITTYPPPTAVDPFLKDKQGHYIGNYAIAGTSKTNEPEKREQVKANIKKKFKDVMKKAKAKAKAHTPEKE